MEKKDWPAQSQVVPEQIRENQTNKKFVGLESNGEEESSCLLINNVMECDLKELHEEYATFLTSMKERDLKTVIDVNRFSSIKKLYRVTCYIFRFVDSLKSKI